MSYVGIDLGTTFSAISYLDEIGNPSIVPVKEGDRICPSLVYRSGEDSFKVGQIASSMAEAEPENVAGNFKRQMPGGGKIKIGEDTFSPVEMSSMILKKLKDDFESQQGPITAAVITIPANWKDAGRRATMEAAKKAGLPVEHIINSPKLQYSISLILLIHLKAGKKNISINISLIHIKGGQNSSIA